MIEPRTTIWKIILVFWMWLTYLLFRNILKSREMCESDKISKYTIYDNGLINFSLQKFPFWILIFQWIVVLGYILTFCYAILTNIL